jgi:hypothetical protein
MPRGDGTGPAGMGAMTGRAAGFCAGGGTPGYANPVPGRGFGTGFGRGRGFRGRGFGGGYGWRNRFHPSGRPGWREPGVAFYGSPAPCGKSDPGAEKEALKSRAESLRNELEAIRKRIEDMGKTADRP